MIQQNISPIYDLLRADGSIVINKNLIFSIGLNESILYTELLAKFNYFSIREQITEDGYFFNTVDNLILDTGLGEKTQRNVIKRLQELELIDYKVQGMPPKRYFKIIDNTQLLLYFISQGKMQRELLEKKQLESADKSKLRLLGGIKTSNAEELKHPNGSVNNTKLNNSNPNKTKGVYIDFPINGDNMLLRIYNSYFYRKFNKNHMQITENNLDTIIDWLIELTSSEVDTDFWNEQVNEHFNNLPKGNNGNILYFMECSHRFFEVPNPKQSAGGY